MNIPWSATETRDYAELHYCLSILSEAGMVTAAERKRITSRMLDKCPTDSKVAR